MVAVILGVSSSGIVSWLLNKISPSVAAGNPPQTNLNEK